MKTVRWGLLSTANVNRHLIPAIRVSERGELVAVASRSQERADSYATKWEIPKAFGSYEALLSSGAVDAVYVGLPNHLHAKWTIRALHSGLHVLCEKPFTISMREMDAVAEAVEESRKVVSEAFMYRHHPQTRTVGQWVRSGRLGEISAVRGVFNFKIQDRENVRLAPEFGGGCLWDVGIYLISFAQYVFGGAPTTVSGMQWLGPSGVDESFVGQMRYPGGGLAQISSSFRAPAHAEVDVIGTEGRLHLSRPFVGMEAGALTFYPVEGEAQIIDVPQQPLYLGEVEDMHAAILDGATPYISLQETRDHVRTALALYASARSGQTIPL